LIGRSEGRRTLGSSRRDWDDNIKMGLQELGWLKIGTVGGLL
jgi:hypothetical protein